jgi:hypothetical protein
MSGIDSNEKSGEAITMQTSRRMCGKVVARKEMLKICFATYLGHATWRINTSQLAGQTDECVESVYCWIGGIGERHNQMHGVEYYKPKTRIQTSNKMPT